MTDAKSKPGSGATHDVGGQTLAGDAADLRADELDGDHERCCEKYRPQQAKAKLGTGLRVSRNTRGIVIRSAGDETGTEEPKDDIERPPATCIGS